MNDFSQGHIQRAAATASRSSQASMFTGMDPWNRALRTTNSQYLETTSNLPTNIMSDRDCQAFWRVRDEGGVSPIQNTHIETCGPMDILAGRTGKRKKNILGEGHPGTKIFDETISRNLQAYQDLPDRRTRSCLIKEVVSDLLSKGCRFVKYDGNVDKFLVLNEKQIRDKVSFAFRHQCNKQEFPSQKRRERRSLRLPLREANEAVEWMMNVERLSSPCSVTSASSVARDLNLEPVSLRSQKSLQPALLFCDTEVKEDTVRGSDRSLQGEEEDDREFIDMIEELDIDDGLTLMGDEEINSTLFDINY